MADWYTKGVGEAQKARKQMGAAYRPDFWLKADTSADVVVLDKEPFNVWQHSIKIRGKWKNYTCSRKNCPLCKVDEARFFAVYRIIDCREYVDKQGKKHKNQERYYVVGARGQPILERLDKKGILYKHILEVTRTGDGMNTVYNYVPSGKPKFEVPKAKLDLMKDFAPKSVEELEVILEVMGVDVERDEEPEEEAPKKARNYHEDEDDDSDAEEDEEAAEEDSEGESDDDGDDDSATDADEDDEDDEEKSDEEEEDADEEEEEPVAKPKKKKKPAADEDDD